MSFRLRTLGTLVLDAPHGATIPTTVLQRRRLALLALLAGSGGMSRDQILGQLWGELDDESARHALSQSLYVIRRALGSDAILAEGTRLRLNPDCVSSDVSEFRAALEEGRTAEAVALYGGRFLEGFHAGGAPAFEAWADDIRRDLERACEEALDALAAAALMAGSPTEAVRWLRWRAAADPFAAEVALSLMRALVAAGDAAAALQHFDSHAAVLREQLGLEPEPVLARYAAELREGRRARPRRTTPPSGARPAHPPPTDAARASRPPNSRAEHLPQGTGSRRVQRRGDGPRIPQLAGGAAAIALLVFLAARWARPPAGVEPGPAEVVLAEVTGPDPGLALALRESLRAELEAAASARLLRPEVVRHALVRMTEAPDARLTAERALQVAQRTGAEFVVEASAMPLGDGAQLVVRLLAAHTGDVLLSVAERPGSEAEILPAIGRAGMLVRNRIRRIDGTAAPPLPAVTTSSLAALKLYAGAREAGARGRRREAIRLAEAALVHDSAFALAHFEAAEQLWFLDRQRRSDDHLRAAVRLSHRLPQRERMIVEARYQQLVRDEPDSALARWRVLAASYPDEPHAYEGMRWAYRALGRTPEMLVASRELLARDSTRALTYATDRIQERLEAGDGATALRLARRHDAAIPGLHAHTAFLAALRSGRFAETASMQGLNPADRVLALLLNDQLDQAAASLPAALDMEVQFPPRVLTWMAHAAADLEPDEHRGNAWLEAVIRWIAEADLSPPAYARLIEKAVLPAALLGDTTAVLRLRTLLNDLDDGRGLRSYSLARQSLEAGLALARGDDTAAARLGEQADPAMYYGRASGVLLFIRAEAHARLGDGSAARGLQHRLLRQEGWSGDPEGAAWLARSIERRQAQHRSGAVRSRGKTSLPR